MDENPTFDFVPTFPCFVAEFADTGMVTIPDEGKRVLVLLSDEHLAQEFQSLVEETSRKQVSLISNADPAELLSLLRIAKIQGAQVVGIDPSGLHAALAGNAKEFAYRAVVIEKAIQALEDHLAQ